MRTPEEQKKFQKLYEENYMLLAGILFRYLKKEEDVKDCLHDVFLYAYESYEKFKNYEEPVSWLILTTKYYALNYRRKAQKHNLHIESYEEDSIQDEKGSRMQGRTGNTRLKINSFEDAVVEEIMYEMYMKKDVIQRAFTQLTVSEKQLYEMKYQKKMTNSQISKELHIKEESVKRKSSRMKKKLMYQLKKEIKNARDEES